jgi:hypothetical protein
MAATASTSAPQRPSALVTARDARASVKETNKRSIVSSEPHQHRLLTSNNHYCLHKPPIMTAAARYVALLSWRHHPCLRRYLGDVRDKCRLSPVRGPDDCSGEHFLKTFTRPDILTVAHRVMVHPGRWFCSSLRNSYLRTGSHSGKLLVILGPSCIMLTRFTRRFNALARPRID